ncbi:TIGR03085 family metal-binding protein [Luedemannella helvata]|uniref:TIGR03085 family metal-binding protein n=1 Tax=Luedemannella helvata TaxID=349315 RepID=A0ABN2KL10_9ACTN
MTRFAAMERQGLADLLDEVGPDAPTLCEGWTARDLAAHLVLRERRPDAAAGILLAPLAGYTERVQGSLAAGPWPRLVAKVRRAPWWSPVSNRLTDELANRVELFVHHEDVRRARPGWAPRALPAGQAEALWGQTRAFAKRALRRVPAAVTVCPTDVAGEMAAGAGGPAVRLSGPTPELLLFLMGRQEHARVDLDGPPEVTDRLRRARFGV